MSAPGEHHQSHPAPVQAPARGLSPTINTRPIPPRGWIVQQESDQNTGTEIFVYINTRSAQPSYHRPNSEPSSPVSDASSFVANSDGEQHTFAKQRHSSVSSTSSKDPEEVEAGGAQVYDVEQQETLRSDGEESGCSPDQCCNVREKLQEHIYKVPGFDCPEKQCAKESESKLSEFTPPSRIKEVTELNRTSHYHKQLCKISLRRKPEKSTEAGNFSPTKFFLLNYKETAGQKRQTISTLVVRNTVVRKQLPHDLWAKDL
ncbi:hypothetical protein BJ508DRAFT_306354 [Ascobolus immersus RN42]|uniref:WW domain-containing protein n=1 Tax=Ascobolus immersus RN42 TaxID=1160509 RepID=A0A3N4I6P5_ASCIM|nr:hypothetical protein BJ508DRAFT_306354 [Ascobolus immersus RN42]